MNNHIINSLKCYKFIVFDCDGVILNSNQIKSQAFYSASLSWGPEAASALLSYHLNNGGISRYEKFRYFFDTIIPSCSSFDQGRDLSTMLDLYSTQVSNSLLNCEMTRSLPYLRSCTAGSKWVVASGSDQSELRTVFQKRRISHFFDAGIFGSPDDKITIVSNLISKDDFAQTLFFGDSLYDYKVAKHYGMDFLFVSDWTDLADWRKIVDIHGIPYIESLNSLLS